MKRSESGIAAVADQPTKKIKKAVTAKEVPVPVAEKKCSNCKDFFPINDFSRCKSNPDGHKYVCKKCDRELQIDYRKKKKVEESREASDANTDNNDSIAGIQGPILPEQQERVCNSWIGDEEDSLMESEDVDIMETTLPDGFGTMDPAKLSRAMSETKTFVLECDEIIAPIPEMPHGQITLLQPGIERLPESKTLTIDFKDRPDLYESIQEIAHDEFRTPEMQVMFWLHDHLVRVMRAAASECQNGRGKIG